MIALRVQALAKVDGLFAQLHASRGQVVLLQEYTCHTEWRGDDLIFAPTRNATTWHMDESPSHAGAGILKVPSGS